MTRKRTHNRIQEKLNNFGVKYGNQVDITKSRIISYMAKELERLEDGRKAEKMLGFTENYTKKYQIRKRQ